MSVSWKPRNCARCGLPVQLPRPNMQKFCVMCSEQYKENPWKFTVHYAASKLHVEDVVRDEVDPQYRDPIKKGGVPFVFKGVAISGKMSAGKTTLAAAIATQYRLPIVSLAGILKGDVATALYDAGLAESEKDIIRLHKGKLRGTLQEWGAIFRDINGPDYWVSRLFVERSSGFIVDDMRFKNEFVALRERGFYLVRLEPPELERLDRVEAAYPEVTTAQLFHQSETDLDSKLSDFDLVLMSGGKNSAARTAEQFFEATKNVKWGWTKR